MSVRAPVLVGGTLLVTPFALSYDLTLIIIPCAFLIREGLRNGFLPYEKIALFIIIGLSASTKPVCDLARHPDRTRPAGDARLAGAAQTAVCTPHIRNESTSTARLPDQFEAACRSLRSRWVM